MTRTFTGIDLVGIPAGEFWMGSPESDPQANDDERPYHRVRISNPYFLAKYPITVGQFQQFVQETAYCTEAEGSSKGAVGLNLATGKVEWNVESNWQKVAFPQTAQHPVVHVSWNDANEFCHWLSGREGRLFRLPTEAEWEYACRAGSTLRYGDSDDEATLRRIANIADASLCKRVPTAKNAATWNDGHPFTSPIGKFRANRFGIYDMLGNVWEWCSDWHQSDYYSVSTEADPPGPDSGTHRILRGGCWYTGVHSTRCACRFGFQPTVRSDCIGFRVAAEE
ncbi:MAG: formylglycine-generating enzyme family protein [Planctomycetota bacterium]